MCFSRMGTTSSEEEPFSHKPPGRPGTEFCRRLHAQNLLKDATLLGFFGDHGKKENGNYHMIYGLYN